MNLLIFDDDLSFIKSLKSSFDILNQKHKGMFSDPTYINDAKGIITYADVNANNPSLYFLDIMVGTITIGFTIAEHIKKVNKKNEIVFMTDYQENILTCIMPHKWIARVFIHKQSNNFLSEMEYVLLAVHDALVCDFLSIDGEDALVKVNLDDIYYLQKKIYTNYIYVIHKDGRDTIKGSLSHVIKNLNSNFYYATKDIIVNTNKITRIDKRDKMLILEDRNSCPYSRRYIKEILALWSR